MPKSSVNRCSNVEDCAIAAQVGVIRPSNVAFELVNGIELLLFDEAFRQAQSHRSVVGPFTGRQTKGAAANHVVNFRERSWRAEF
jgi:hypothetical protein